MFKPSGNSELTEHGLEALEALRELADDGHSIVSFKLSENSVIEAKLADDYGYFDLEWSGEHWLDWQSGKRFSWKTAIPS